MKKVSTNNQELHAIQKKMKTFMVKIKDEEKFDLDYSSDKED